MRQPNFDKALYNYEGQTNEPLKISSIEPSQFSYFNSTVNSSLENVDFKFELAPFESADNIKISSKAEPLFRAENLQSFKPITKKEDTKKCSEKKEPEKDITAKIPSVEEVWHKTLSNPNLPQELDLVIEKINKAAAEGSCSVEIATQSLTCAETIMALLREKKYIVMQHPTQLHIRWNIPQIVREIQV